ncbi:apoptosis-stimulating of p53 protein 2-like isoform X1 [Stegodyphus dumicola]|uniref:apoptosis-stimulating of p53 protein 2-like isoform X1 n=1 Tax=Stegodyphus dumicola TaxID=202533 RepID=UPI0015ABB1D5|nr:apoptosis-stimulating of p53 protein 2-like isoform X1 [Stegodyphus dumicola]
MLSQRQTHSTTKDKNLDERELVNVALSVLQNKSSDQEKNAFSNYRERLLYYQCVPRYSKDACPDQSSAKSKIVTYFPKPSEPSSQQDTKSNESFDHSESPKRKAAFGQLPIKPKPLTIRKTPGLEPPKLKVQPVVNTNLNRKINESHLLSAHLKTSISPSFISNSIEDSFVEDKLKPEDVKDLDEPPTSVEIPPLKSSSEDISPKTAEKEEVIDIWQPMQPVIEKEISPEKYELGEICKLESTIGSEKQETDDVITADETDDAISHSAALRRIKKGNLKSEGSVRHCRRVSFDPLALLLDAALEGELELVKKTASEVPNPSAANDEGITALHNAICAGHFDVVTFLVEFGCDVNAQDSDGWTPLHCAASCNNLPMVKFLVERGACIFATTLSDHETAAEKCEEEDEGFDGCSEYLYSLQENLGVMNNGIVYAVYDYEVQNADELSFKDGDMLTVLRKGDDEESEWWWSRLLDEEGYVPRNLLGLYPRVTSRKA